jgi:hypothetical protein
MTTLRRGFVERPSEGKLLPTSTRLRACPDLYHKAISRKSQASASHQYSIAIRKESSTAEAFPLLIHSSALSRSFCNSDQCQPVFSSDCIDQSFDKALGLAPSLSQFRQDSPKSKHARRLTAWKKKKMCVIVNLPTNHRYNTLQTMVSAMVSFLCPFQRLGSSIECTFTTQS